MIIELFSTLWNQFFSLSQCFRGQKVQIQIESISAGTYRSVSPTLRECEKAQLVMNFLDVATHFSSKQQGPNLHSESQTTVLNLEKSILLKMRLLSSTQWNLDGPVMQEKCH